MGPFWRYLETAVFSMGQPWPILTEAAPAAPLSTKTLPLKAKTPVNSSNLGDSQQKLKGSPILAMIDLFSIIYLSKSSFRETKPLPPAILLN